MGAKKTRRGGDAAKGGAGVLRGLGHCGYLSESNEPNVEHGVRVPSMHGCTKHVTRRGDFSTAFCPRQHSDPVTSRWLRPRHFGRTPQGTRVVFSLSSIELENEKWSDTMFTGGGREVKYN